MKKLAKTLYILFVVAIMVLATSCNPDLFSSFDENYTNEQPIVPTEETPPKNSRSITVSVDSTESNIEYFKYKFTPLFSDDTGKDIVGDTKGEWITTSEFPTDWNIFLEQGKWNIKIEMYDSTGTQIGNTLDEDVYFSKANSDLGDTFSEWLISTGTGKIKFEDIVIPKLYALPVRYEMTANGDSKEVKTYSVEWYLIQNGSVKFNGTLNYLSSNGGLSTFGDATISNIPVGSYILSLVIYEGLDSSTSVAVGGEMTDMVVFRGCTSKINALIDTSDYIYSTFRAQQTETGYTGRIKATYTAGAKTATLELFAENATNVMWFQDGVYMPSYGSGTVANVKNIASGAVGAGIVGTMSNYFDCLFTDSATGEMSSCSYVLVAGGTYGGQADDSSVFTLETGNEISYWKYNATPIDAIGDSFGSGSGQTTKSIYLDERMWTISASAYNSEGRELSNGIFEGYINKSDKTIDVSLNSIDGNGWINIGSITASRNLNIGSRDTRVLSWTITDMSTGQVVSSCTGSSSLSGSTNSLTWTFNPNVSYELPKGQYRVDLVTSVRQQGANYFLVNFNGTYKGYCSILVNVHAGVTTIVQGSLTSNYKV